MEKEKIRNKNKKVFQSTNKQALEAIKKLQEKGKIKSVGTNRNYLAALKHIAKHTTGNLRDLTNDQATQYLVDRSIEVGQKSLDMSRQVMQHLLNEKLAVIKTEKKRNIKRSRRLHTRTSKIYSKTSK
jgi:hypothetical protein